ncbi:hypothetical protein GRX01_06500 [Halobaculum sp. WSA2]|uniref:Uncharacterized protein n=1 Tax=Halobaculum saliterrae TaxID=2073113 RepID=A0A6B0SWE8_9EURY|nr:hypothetical protein [Halobaculum saliterrae]MXR40991.1 hypothetical protein [Halobaculum saliterrae]
MPLSRRATLLKLGSAAAVATGVAAGVTGTGAYTSVRGDRGVDVSVADGTGGLVGIVPQGPVKKNSRDPLVELTNNTDRSLTITVALADCAAGTLYDNDGESGCSVSITLGAGNSQFIDVVASTTGTIGFSVDVEGPSLSLAADRSVEAESGNSPGAVRIQKPSKDKDFGARANKNEWTAKADVRDDDGDGDLDRVEFEVTEGDSGGTLVASRTVSTPPTRYKENVTLSPDDPTYDIRRGQQYTLVVRAYDVDGNVATATVQTTA